MQLRQNKNNQPTKNSAKQDKQMVLELLYLMEHVQKDPEKFRKASGEKLEMLKELHRNLIHLLFIKELNNHRKPQTSNLHQNSKPSISTNGSFFRMPKLIGNGSNLMIFKIEKAINKPMKSRNIETYGRKKPLESFIISVIVYTYLKTD